MASAVTTGTFATLNQLGCPISMKLDIIKRHREKYVRMLLIKLSQAITIENDLLCGAWS
jgi:hypothetical protein